MTFVYEYKFDENGEEMVQVLEDTKILNTEINEKVFPELYKELKEQYENSQDHFYYLSEDAHKQLQQKRFGLVTTL